MHGPQNVPFFRKRHFVLLVVRQDHHIFPGVAEVLVQIGRHVLDVVDASSQLAFLAKVVDPDK